MKKSIIVLLSLFLFQNFAYGFDKKPNVLFIIIDDLNDYVSLLENYPGLKTPNLDKFSKSAMTFSHGYCAGPICNPSRTALLSGITPHKSGVYDNRDKMSKSIPVVNSILLPEQFKKNGYYTMWNGKLYHTGMAPERMKAQWDDTEGGKGKYGPRAKHDAIPAHIKRPGLFNYEAWEGPDTDFSDFNHMLINEKRLSQKYDKPFFMVYGIYRPHNPWTAPKRFFDLYPLDKLTLPEVPENDLDDIPDIGKKYAAYPVSFKDIKEAGQWKPILQSYLASISFMDFCLGRVLDALENGPNADNTIVCLVADHGFHMGEKEHFAKYALWEKTTHTLFIWRVPGVTKPGSTCDATVSLLDLYPTFNELCDMSDVPQNLDGKSIAPLLKDPASEWNRPILTTYLQNDYAVRDNRWRYIKYHDGSEELYDHSKDKNEWTNLADNSEYNNVKEKLGKYMPKTSAEPVSNKK